MFWSKKKKKEKIGIPCIPQFYYIKLVSTNNLIIELDLPIGLRIKFFV